MVFNVKGFGGVKETDKAKAKSKTSSAGGPSFSAYLDEAQGVDSAGESSPVSTGMDVAGGFVPIEEDFPKEGRGQANDMLNSLKELAEHALSGSPTSAAGRLEALAADVDESNLTDEQKRVLNEVRTRAAVEVAKLKS